MKITRLFSQMGFFILFFLVPILNIFRMDLIQLRFYVFGKSFAFNEGYILLLCVLLMIFIFVGISKWFGRQFCGWMCPHNTFSVYIIKLTNSHALKNSPGLRKLLDIGLSVLFAPIIAFSMVSYFFDPFTLFKQIFTLQWTSWSVGAYLVLVGFFFIMIFRLRSRFCRHACPYGMFQMIFADKNSSRADGLKNMFKGTGLLLFLIICSLLGLLGFSIATTDGFSAMVEKQIQGAPAGDYSTYTYDLKIQNNQHEEMKYYVTYEGIPTGWDVKLPEEIMVEGSKTHAEPMIFRIDKASLNNNHDILIKLDSTDGHHMEKKLIIFPVLNK